MREKLEKILYDHLKTSLPAELKSMLVRGHSTEDRHIPYICVDVGEIKPFGDMHESDGIFESEVNVAIADSAHDIDYKYLFPRISAVRAILGTFTLESEKYRCEGLWFESETDARNDNNMGVILSYKLVFQRL